MVLVALGITLAVLGSKDILPYNFVPIGSSMAPAALVILIAYECLQKNWILEAFKRAMRENNPDNFQSVIDQCRSEAISFWWDCCDARGPVLQITSSKLSGNLTDEEISNPINEFVKNNANTIENRASWNKVLNNLINLNGMVMSPCSLSA